MSVAQVSWQGGVCRLLLDRPGQGNALSPALVEAIDATVAECAARGAALLVIEGAGRHTCTGFDLSGLEHATDDSLLARFVRIELMLQRLARAPFPTLAVARGRTVGAGADLFTACTHRVMAADATLAFPGARGFGLVLGSRRLAARVGAERALDWAGSARTIGAPEALASGLATQVLEAGHTLEAAIAAARAPAPQPAVPGLAAAIAGDAGHDDARDLAALVHSAARPGLRDLVVAYVERQARARAATH